MQIPSFLGEKINKNSSIIKRKEKRRQKFKKNIYFLILVLFKLVINQKTCVHI